MQDMELLDGEQWPIGSLLIDAPGEKPCGTTQITSSSGVASRPFVHRAVPAPYSLFRPMHPAVGWVIGHPCAAVAP